MCGDTPTNGRTKRKHQHILNVARALKIQASLPTKFLADCILHAVYLINRIPLPILSHKSPYSMVFGTNPDLTSLRVFDCLCYTSTKKAHRGKFEARARKYVFIGFSTGTKGYKLYDLHSWESFLSRDLMFYEDTFPFVVPDQEAIKNHLVLPAVEDLSMEDTSI